MRKVVAYYTGALLSVRANGGPNNGALANIFPAASPAGGLAVNSPTGASYSSWIGSAGTGRVVFWYDQSGNGQDATQTIPSLQPTLAPTVGGLPGFQISFPNQTAFLNVASPFAVAGAWVQYYLNSLGTSTTGIGLINMFGNPLSNQIDLRLWASNSNQSAGFSNPSIIARAGGYLQSFPAGNGNDWTSAVNGMSTENAILNGSPYFQPAYPAQLRTWNTLALSNPLVPITITTIGEGSYGPNDNRNRDGAITELIFYSSALADKAAVLYSSRLQSSASNSPPASSSPHPPPPPPRRFPPPPPPHKSGG